MKRSRRLSRLADFEGEGLQQVRLLLNAPLSKNIVEKKASNHDVSFPDLFHALSLTQSTPLFTPPSPLSNLKYTQVSQTFTTNNSSACSSTKSSPTSSRKRVPSFLCSPDSCDNGWCFNDIPISDEPYPPLNAFMVPSPPCSVAPTRYVVSKRRVLVCTKVRKRNNDTTFKIFHLKTHMFSLLFPCHSFLWSVNSRWIKSF